MQNGHSSAVRIAIDRGGTFCDFYASCSGKTDLVFKLLSVDPGNYQDAPTEGIRRIIEHFTGESIPRGTKIPLDSVESVRMGTTVATNALLERNGERCALLTSYGYRDVLRIGTQARPDIFDLSIKKLSQLYERVIELDERITLESSAEDPNQEPIDVLNDPDLLTGSTGEVVRIIRRPNPAKINAQLDELYAQGFRSLALALLHSYTYDTHEKLVADLARAKGFSVSVSSEVQPLIKIISRANSTVADAYLTPITTRYIESFASGFQGGLKAFGSKLLLMQSDGGLTTWDNFSGLRAILSGPAGGVIGFSRTCYDEEEKMPLVAVDMGGTSTDVSRFDSELDHTFESVTAQVIISAPQLNIDTVAAGGGSRLFWRNNMFMVGPESASAHPGPACYRKGGPLAITDANLQLGRLVPSQFPKIFGPNEDESLDGQATNKAFQEISKTINESQGGNLSPEEVALGFLRVAVEAMCRPVRSLTEARGYETAGHNLVMFGGAGGQVACAIAKTLGIKRTLVPRFSSILSAYGMALSDVTVDLQEAVSAVLTSFNNQSLDDRQATLKAKGVESLRSQGFEGSYVEAQTYYNCHFAQATTYLMIKVEPGVDLVRNFLDKHFELFGFVLDGRDIIVESVRVRAIGLSPATSTRTPYAELKSVQRHAYKGDSASQKIYFDKVGWQDARLIALAELEPGCTVVGPAIIYDKTQTILVEPGFEAVTLSQHVVLDKVEDSSAAAVQATGIDPVQLSVFSHRFMSIAEQMGNALRQTSISTNIKERLDFSCALFSPDGGLVANAPHIPVHLGAMSKAVAHQAAYWGDNLVEGDVLLSNHPAVGGSHLPDFTVITPAFHNGKIVFWTASRAHHADIGGTNAGSMPPSSKYIWQEGAQFKAFKLVKQSEFQEAEVTHALLDEPAQYPGCSGTRTLGDNLSDLRAQCSANHRGVSLIAALVKEYSLPTVQKYMHAIQDTAEQAVRDLMKQIAKKFDGAPLEAVDYMDDGSEIHLKIQINGDTGSASFDFTGTTSQVYGNLNAPTAIVYSAVLYVLRSLIHNPIPLNQGCLTPIDLIIPPATLISPSGDVATVAGNVETSARLADVILKAFQAAAASQGTCNNFTFGYGGKDPQTGKVTKGFGYYETICGGAGAGEGWDGQSGVQCHMTNTAVGDSEVIERRYPVVIHEFSIREGSGGSGKWSGGCGIVRDFEFRRPINAAILSERRVIRPFGMKGGTSGQCGRNMWLKKQADGSYQSVNVGGKAEFAVAVGDRFVIHTPGGGGCGAPEKQ